MAPGIVLSRREFVKDAGGLLIGFALTDAIVLPRLLAESAPETVAAPSPQMLDAWLQIDAGGSVRVFTGKVEIGMGVETALAQIVAEELDVSPERVAFVMGDTSLTVNQGGVGGSTSIAMGAKPLRNVAASARSLLLELASRRLDVPLDQLEVDSGIIRVKGSSAKNLSYGELTQGADLNETLKTSGAGFGLNVQGLGKPKDPASYTIVGKSLPRVDLRPKILGQWQYITDVRLPGMLHGRVVRPKGVGSKLVSVDEDSLWGVPGYVKTVVNGNFIGVVAESEWAAVRAASALKVTWTAPEQAFPEQQKLYDYMRSTAPKASKETLRKGDVDAAMRDAAKKVEATYEFPFQSHATMGPGCAVADVHRDGVTTVWSGTQKPHALQEGIADLLRIPADKLRVIWVEDSGSYGRAGFEDVAADAALLSDAAGKPVRLQWTRADMTAWGTKGPAVTCDMIAGLDAQGHVIALQFTSRAFSGSEISPAPTIAGDFLGAQLAGMPSASATNRNEFAEWGSATVAYGFPNIQANAHVVPAFFDTASPLRTTHLRDPEGPATTFAFESFIDDIAAAAGVDPIEFRLRNLEDVRMKATLTTAAEKFRWDARSSPGKMAGASEIARGRGVAIGDRGGTRVATIAEVEVNRSTGKVRVKRFVCAHDCGLIINPEALRGTIAANLVQSLSRALMEEVTFDRSSVTSVDWKTYPVARGSEIPERFEIVLISHPEIPSSGAGEPSSRPTAAAINNAIFDAIGIRVRQASSDAGENQGSSHSSANLLGAY